MYESSAACHPATQEAVQPFSGGAAMRRVEGSSRRGGQVFMVAPDVHHGIVPLHKPGSLNSRA